MSRLWLGFVTSNRLTHNTEVMTKSVSLTRLRSTLISNGEFVLLGKRPFGVSILYAGWDKHYGFQLYQSDPSGHYGGWKAACIGNNSNVSGVILIHTKEINFLTGIPLCPGCAIDVETRL